MSTVELAAKRAWRGNRHAGIVGAYVGALLLFGVTSSFSPGFASVAHVRFLLITASFIGTVALGQTFVILSGGIDLSVAWTMTATAMLTTILTAGSDAQLVWVLPLVAGVGAGIGLINGIGVALMRVPPIVMTLGTSVIIQGVLLAYIGGAPPNTAPHFLARVADGRIAGIPLYVVGWLVLTGIATVVLTFTGFGRRLYAVGTNQTVAVFSGIRVAPVIVTTYIVSGLTAAVAGVALTGFNGQSYVGLGTPYLFSSVAAVGIGGASILGGDGNYLGTVAGALILTFLAGLLPILNLQQGWLQISYGLIILLTIGLAAFRRRERAV